MCNRIGCSIYLKQEYIRAPTAGENLSYMVIKFSISPASPGCHSGISLCVHIPLLLCESMSTHWVIVLFLFLIKIFSFCFFHSLVSIPFFFQYIYALSCTRSSMSWIPAINRQNFIIQTKNKTRTNFKKFWTEQEPAILQEESKKISKSLKNNRASDHTA